ncbi:hypothetical protein DRQ53_09780, partial [bacterium]
MFERRRVATHLTLIPLLAVICAAALPAAQALAAKPGMGWRDLVQVRKVESPVISDDGRWIALTARPDRGDAEAVFREVDGRDRWSIARGSSPLLSANGTFGAVLEQPTFEARETAEEDDELSSTAILLDLESGEQTRFERAESCTFSADGKWFVVLHEAPEEEEAEEEEAEEGEAEESEAEKEAAVPEAEDEADEPEPRDAGTPLVLIRLADGARFEYADVIRMSWSQAGALLALVQETATGLDNRIFVLECAEGDPAEHAIAAADSTTWQSWTWARELPLLAVVSADTRDPEQPVDMLLLEFDGSDGSVQQRVADSEFGEAWTLPLDNDLEYSRDGRRLFFGLREREVTDEEGGQIADGESADTDDTDDTDETSAEDEPFDILDIDALLEERSVDVWHTDDPRIKPHERKTFEERRDHLYLALLDREAGSVQRLADEELAEVF